MIYCKTERIYSVFFWTSNLTIIFFSFRLPFLASAVLYLIGKYYYTKAVFTETEINNVNIRQSVPLSFKNIDSSKFSIGRNNFENPLRYGV